MRNDARRADLGRPDRFAGAYRTNGVDPQRPLIQVPPIPVQGKAMHCKDVDLFADTVIEEGGNECRIDGRDATEHARQARRHAADPGARLTHHLGEQRPVRVERAVPM
jgi:uncharacterized Zn-binding protein involved in type VI secretion